MVVERSVLSLDEQLNLSLWRGLQTNVWSCSAGEQGVCWCSEGSAAPPSSSSLRGTFKLPLIRNRRPQLTTHVLAPVVCHRIPEAALHLHLFSQEARSVFAVAEPSIPARKLVPDSHFQRKWLAQVSGLGDQGLDIRVWASELWDRGSGIKNQGSGIRTQDSGLRGGG